MSYGKTTISSCEYGGMEAKPIAGESAQYRGVHLLPDDSHRFRESGVGGGSLPALNIVRHPSSKDWHRFGVGFHHLSHVLRHAYERSPEGTCPILGSRRHSHSADEQIEKASTGGLEFSLLGLANALPEQHGQIQLSSSG